MKQKLKIIVSGGGTGGHIYPALAVVAALEKELGKENVEPLFMGAEGKMEMTIIPKAGYKVIGVPVRGFKRKITVENFKILFDFLKSLSTCRKIVKDFQPDAIIGFGGYACAPVIYASRNQKNIKKYLWEGNSFAGAANRFLGRYADKIFVSFDKMNRFFEESKIIKSGNPVRAIFGKCNRKEGGAIDKFELDKDKKIVLITGGSLGARVLNESVMKYIDSIIESGDISLIWQTGSYYLEEMKERCKDKNLKNIWMGAFIDNMQEAYSAADLIVCRSGASTVTEVALAGIPALFVPSSGVTDDHQTKNAQALTEIGAADLISDSEAVEMMIPKAVELIQNEKRLEEMSKKMDGFAIANSAQIIALEIIKN